MSLHTKYRPLTLDEIVGNEASIIKLKAQLENPEGPHVFLFSGTKGCGKTSLARIAAEMVNAHENDINEIDVADKENRGTAAATVLKNGVMYKPMFGDVKVYILDECHMMTTAYGNSLLKILEDTPKHVYFFLCTTDPQKLLGTVKSRCSAYVLESLSQKEIVELLEWVITEEEANITKPELKKISEVCEGIPRDALVLLDQIIKLNPEEREGAIESIKIKERNLKELCTALLDRKSWKVVAKILKEIKQEPESIRMGVMGYMNAVLLGGSDKITITNAALVMDELREPCYSAGELSIALYMSLQ